MSGHLVDILEHQAETFMWFQSKNWNQNSATMTKEVWQTDVWVWLIILCFTDFFLKVLDNLVTFNMGDTIQDPGERARDETEI